AMSVINQVLNQLEQRGAPAAPEQTMVRPVPPGKHNLTLPLLAAGLALAGGIAAWQWIQVHKPKVVEANVVRQQSTVVAIPATASAITASAVVAASAVSIAAESEAHLIEVPPPVSHLSFELSSVPLPSSLRELRIRAEPSRVKVPTVNTAPPVQVVKPQSVTSAYAADHAPEDASSMKQVSPVQRADAEFRRAVVSMQQGHIADAIAGYREALRLDAGHDEARQALVALLLESKQGAEAERMLQERLDAKPGHTGFAMLLARLQVEHGALEQAVATLEKSLPHADAQAEYQSFFAALLQRQNRHKEAITHYQIALQLAPGNGVWLMGYGISLQEMQRADDARNAFRRALESNMLKPELQAFVRQKLKEL
ncbi:MAG TPA: tetratricopeptide repeat protein, partial [Gallionella sp.]|nr:tetratricopeptide repeat protein [Gallionella sp.]